MSESSAIDQALVARLNADATLRALVPDGVWFDAAPVNAQRFVIVSLVIARDVAQFHRRAIEDVIYLVKAVIRNASAEAAADRIDTLLENAPLAVAGYSLLMVHRAERVRYSNPDTTDKTVNWFHRGGRYRVVVTPTTIP